MLRIAISVLIVALAAFVPSILLAQSHFKQCATMTGSDGTILIPDRAEISVNGSAIPISSEIAVFTEGGKCAGVVVWKKRSTGLSIWGDDEQTQIRDGFRKGETILFRIWDPSKRIEYDSAKQPSTIKFAPAGSVLKGDRSFGEDAIYVLQHLAIGSEKPQKKKAVAAPVLTAPQNEATRQPPKLELKWRTVEGAKHYKVQVSTSTEFRPKRTTTATTASLGFSPPGLRADVVYFWRVRAVTKNGSGPWSKVRRFRTSADRGRLAENGASSTDSSAAARGNIGEIVGGAVEQDVPETFELYPNYPNPFNPSTTIRFDVPQASPVRIAIYNATGAEVDVLVAREMGAGSHSVVWKADGRPSGIYFCRIQAGGWSSVRTLVLLK